MRLRRISVLIMIVLLLASGFQVVLAQDNTQDTCEQFMERVIDDLWMHCADIEDDNVCYGYQELDVKFENDLGVISQPGEKEDTTWLKKLESSRFNLVNDEWGVTLFQIDAYIGDDTDGEPMFSPVKYMLVGDAEVEQVYLPEFDEDGEMILDETHRVPMQDFFLRNGFNKPSCPNLPKPALLVQTPKDVDTMVEISINGVKMRLHPGTTAIVRDIMPTHTAANPGSSALLGPQLNGLSAPLLQTYEAQYIEVSDLAGLVEIYDNGTWVIVPPGFQVQICLDAYQNLGIDGDPNDQLPAQCPPLDLLGLTVEDLADFQFFELTGDVTLPVIIIRSGLGGPEISFYFSDPQALIEAGIACSYGLVDPTICAALGF